MAGVREVQWQYTGEGGLARMTKMVRTFQPQWGLFGITGNGIHMLGDLEKPSGLLGSDFFIYVLSICFILIAVG